jgi:cohesin complex subunit SA-1/2
MSSSPPPDMDVSTLKRASGRVRKQPETIYPSSDPVNQKRKRAQDADGDEEMEDEELSEEESPSEEDEPDEEELRDKKARARKPKGTAAARKPAAKKPKTNGATSLPIRGGAKVARKRAPKKAKQLDLTDAEDAGGLFAEVFAHGRDLQEIAREWRQSFGNYESKALAEVINFVLRAAGCTSKVTEHDIEDPDAVASKIEDLQHEYQATEPTDYPFMSKVKNAASFKQGVTGFLDVLIRSIAEDKLLYNNPELIENIQVWFTSMSTASNRAFRHTSTVVSLCVVTSLSTVASNVSDNAAKSHRMVETERKKGNKTNKQRLQSMEASAKEASQLQEFVEALLKDWFDTIFVHRYRDKDISIRRECMAALGEWIVTAPSTFFDGHHLRYMGWMLSDLAPVVRGEVIKQLIRFFKMPDMIGGLKTFTERFRNRMVEIASLDSESHVRASGVELLDLLRENGLLEPDDVDAVGRLVFDADPKVRKTVASFLSESINELCTSKIDDIGGLESLEESLPEANEDSYDAPRLEWLKLKCLSEVLEAYDSEESLPSQIERSHGEGGLTLLAAGADSRFTLAASVLYDTMEEVQDWRMLAGYLLFDHASEQANGVADDALSQLKHEASLSVQEETILLEVLNASVKRNLTDAAEKLTSTKAKLTKRQKNDLQAEQEEAASDLAAIIPRLLRKFGDSSDTAAAVLRLESILSLPSLHDLRQDSSTFSSLLGDIKKQFMSHSSDKVLEPASVAILHAKSYGELDESAEEKITGLWEDVVQNFSELIDAKKLIARGIASFEELVALSNNLLRTVRLSSVSDCVVPLEDRDIINFESTQEDLKSPIDCILALIQRAIPDEETSIEPDEAALEDQIAVRAADAALFYFRWKLKSFTDRLIGNPPADIPYEELEALAERRDRYVALINEVLAARKANEDVCAAMVGYQLDMYTSAATLKSIQVREGMSDDFTVLIMEFDRETESRLLKIFSASEQKYARLSGKRLEDAPLAAADADGDLDIDADPIDDDPVSEPESDDEDEQPTHNQSQSQAQASQQRKETKQLATLLAEQRLCELTGKIVTAVIGGIMSPSRARPRLERNRLRLGPNYKEVCAYFDIEDVQAKKGGRKGAAAKTRNAASSKTKSVGKPSAKSNAIVAEDEEDDEIEDPEEDDPEVLKRRGLVVEEDVDDEEEAARDNGAGAEEHADEMESVLGD